jgi:hypothetical protein
MDNESTDEQTIEHPASMGLEEALDFLEKTPDSGDTTPGEEDDPKEGELDTDDTNDETDDEDSDEEQTEEDEDSEEDEDDDSDSDEEDDVLFTVGEGEDEIVVTDIEEAKKGYLRQQDYTKKSQEVAALKTELDKDKSEYIEAKAAYVEGLSKVQASLSEQMQQFVGIDWVELQKDDPFEFEQKQSEFNAAKLAFEQVQAEGAAKEQEVMREAAEYMQTVRTEELGKLANLFPEINEENNTLLEDTLQAGQEFGFSKEELEAIFDHRQISVLITAFQGKKLLDKVSKGKQKAKKHTKSITPKAKQSSSTAKARKAKKVKQTLSRPGGVSIDEALDMIG